MLDSSIYCTACGNGQTMVVEKPSQLDMMIAWEQGELSEEDMIILFQGLIDSGVAWSLQGCYGRQAMRLIQAGECRPLTTKNVVH